MGRDLRWIYALGGLSGVSSILLMLLMYKNDWLRVIIRYISYNAWVQRRNQKTIQETSKRAGEAAIRRYEEGVQRMKGKMVKEDEDEDEEASLRARIGQLVQYLQQAEVDAAADETKVYQTLTQLESLMNTPQYTVKLYEWIAEENGWKVVLHYMFPEATRGVALSLLVNGMQHKPSRMSVNRMACQEVVKLLQECMIDLADDHHEWIIQLLLILLNLSVDVENEEILVEEGCLVALMKLIAHPSGDIELKYQSFRVCVNIITSSLHAKQSFVSLGGYNKCIQILCEEDHQPTYPESLLLRAIVLVGKVIYSCGDMREEVLLPVVRKDIAHVLITLLKSHENMVESCIFTMKCILDCPDPTLARQFGGYIKDEKVVAHLIQLSIQQPTLKSCIDDFLAAFNNTFN